MTRRQTLEGARLVSPSFADLPPAFAAAEQSARTLAALAESIERGESNPAARAALIHLNVSVGEFRDRLHSLRLDMQRAGYIPE